jgi:proteic killer suppression protein
MIRSFKSRDAERLFNRERVPGLPADLHRPAARKLRMLHRARTLRDLRVPPGNRLEQLKGDREGHYSIRINDQFRICFRWEAGDAHDVEIVDYHR